jgi:hypothetical protein
MIDGAVDHADGVHADLQTVQRGELDRAGGEPHDAIGAAQATHLLATALQPQPGLLARQAAAPEVPILIRQAAAEGDVGGAPAAAFEQEAVLRRAEGWVKTIEQETGAQVPLPGMVGQHSLEKQLSLP